VSDIVRLARIELAARSLGTWLIRIQTQLEMSNPAGIHNAEVGNWRM